MPSVKTIERSSIAPVFRKMNKISCIKFGAFKENLYLCPHHISNISPIYPQYISNLYN